jgi:hypothetical protein
MRLRNNKPEAPAPTPAPRACATLEESGKCSTPGCTATHDLCERYMNDFGSCKDPACGKAHPRYTAYVRLSDCAVCMELMAQDEYQLPCTHVFHRHCLQSCLGDSSVARCPVCREGTFTAAQLGAPVMPERYRGMARR